MVQLKQTSQLDILTTTTTTTISNTNYSCMDCEWDGDIAESDFDTEYDEFKGVDRKFPICPKCGGGLDY